MANKLIEIMDAGWENEETECGYGSSRDFTQVLRVTFQRFLDRFKIKSIGDAGCGNLDWIKEILLENPEIEYTGYDVIRRPSWDKLVFDLRILDITKERVSSCDMIVCRDVFIHLPNTDVVKALSKFRDSQCKFLFSTTFPFVCNEGRILEPSSTHSKINLSKLIGYDPIEYIPETYGGKIFALWKI